MKKTSCIPVVICVLFGVSLLMGVHDQEQCEEVVCPTGHYEAPGTADVYLDLVTQTGGVNGTWHTVVAGQEMVFTISGWSSGEGVHVTAEWSEGTSPACSNYFWEMTANTECTELTGERCCSETGLCRDTYYVLAQ